MHSYDTSIVCIASICNIKPIIAIIYIIKDFAISSCKNKTETISISKCSLNLLAIKVMYYFNILYNLKNLPQIFS